MNKKLLAEAKSFLENFTFPIDYDALIKKLNELSKMVCEDYGIADKALRVEFEESENFGKSAVVNDVRIKINKLRLQTLLETKFDDTQPKKLKKQIDSLMKSYDEKSASKFEKIIHDYVLRMRKMDADELVCHSGSYKTIKYDLLNLLFHENEHTKQKQYEKYLTNVEGCPEDLESMILVFSMFYVTIYWELLDKKVLEWTPPENHRFPTEFDARYFELIKIEELRKKYFADDELFKKHILSTIIIPEKFDSKADAERLFAELEKYYDLDKEEKYKGALELVEKHKNEIVKELERRFTEMLEIREANSH